MTIEHSTAADLAVDHVRRRFGDHWDLALRIADAIDERGLILDTVPDTETIYAYIGDHIVGETAVARVKQQTANILKLWNRSKTEQAAAGSTYQAFAKLLGGTDGRNALAEALQGKASDKAEGNPVGLGMSGGLDQAAEMASTEIYARAIAAGPDATPAELWNVIENLAANA